MAPSKTYRFMVFSNPMPEAEAAYLDWYLGQHIHDLLSIEGFVGAQMFRMAGSQYGSPPGPQRYLMVWEIRTSDLAAVFDRVKANLQNGLTVKSDAFDWSSVASMTVEPVSARVTLADVAGLSPPEIGALARRGA